MTDTNDDGGPDTDADGGTDTDAPAGTDTDTDTHADTAADLDDLELTDAEEAALHELQLGIEHVHRAYGTLLEFHHQLGHAMDRMADAEDELRAAGHEAWADRLRDEHLPAGAISDQWTYELVEEFSTEFLEEVDAFEGAVRDELADGIDHVTERRQKRRLRERSQQSEQSQRSQRPDRDENGATDAGQ